MAMLGDVFLNTVYEEKPKTSVKTTDHAIENGENITDHVEKTPKTVSISGVVTGSDASMRKVKIEQYMNGGTLLKYSYRHILTNVLITDFDTTHDVDVKGGFKFSMTLKIVKIANKTVIKTKEKAQTAPVSNKGLQQPKGTTAAKVYVVKKGDSLSKIGAQFGVSWSKIFEKNKGIIGTNPNRIYAGQKLVIPA